MNDGPFNLSCEKYPTVWQDAASPSLRLTLMRPAADFDVNPLNGMVPVVSAGRLVLQVTVPSSDGRLEWAVPEGSSLAEAQIFVEVEPFNEGFANRSARRFLPRKCVPCGAR